MLGPTGNDVLMGLTTVREALVSCMQQPSGTLGSTTINIGGNVGAFSTGDNSSAHGTVNLCEWTGRYTDWWTSRTSSAI